MSAPREIDDDRLEELLWRYVDGQLQPAEQRAVAELLAQRPELARRLFALADEQLALEDALAHEEEEAREAAAPVCPAAARIERLARGGRPGRRPRSPHRVSRLAHIAVPMAAAAAILLALAYRGARRPRRAARAEESEVRPISRVAAGPEVPGAETRAPEKTDDTQSAGRHLIVEGRRDQRDVPTAIPDLAAQDDLGLEGAQEAPASAPAPARTGPVAAGTDTKTGGHVAYVDALEGGVECARAGADGWTKAAAGVPLGEGGRLRTKISRARVAYESGTVLFVNRWTTLTFAAGEAGRPGLTLAAGEVFVETQEQGKGFWVETRRGRAVDLGTSFAVREAEAGTTVTVVAGQVEVSTDAGSARLEKHQEVLMAKRSSPPGNVRTARNIRQRLAWVEELRPAIGTLVIELDEFGNARGVGPAKGRRGIVHLDPIGGSTRGHCLTVPGVGTTIAGTVRLNAGRWFLWVRYRDDNHGSPTFNVLVDGQLRRSISCLGKTKNWHWERIAFTSAGLTRIALVSTYEGKPASTKVWTSPYSVVNRWDVICLTQDEQYDPGKEIR